MILIAAVDKNWAIGADGGMLFRLPLDMRRFKQLTEGNTVIMGRKTLESLPPAFRPLPNRINIVLTSRPQLLGSAQNLFAATSVEQAVALARAQNSPQIYVIGGASVYEQFLPYCSLAEITRVDAAAQNADAYFPNLDAAGWAVAQQSGEVIDNGFSTRYLTYEYKR